MASRAPWCAIAAVVCAAVLQTQGSLYPAVPQIAHANLGVVLQDYARVPFSSPTSDTYPPEINFTRQLSRVTSMFAEPRSSPESAMRLFVLDLNRQLYIFDAAARNFTPYINFEEVFPKFVSKNGRGGGLSALAFDPDYARNGRFYTVHTEKPSSEGPDTPTNVSLPGLDLTGYTTTASVDPPAGTVGRQVVLVEWTDNDRSDRTFAGTAREVLRVGFTRITHGIADMQFNPLAHPGDADYGNLYIAVGDGGAAKQDDETDTIPQRLDALSGKILRITPDVSLRLADELSANGRYRIPTTGADPNPFTSLSLANVKKEIYAYGFRNPQRMSWDAPSNLLIGSDIGVASWEEVNIITKGANYGFPEREGAEQLFIVGDNDRITGSQLTPPVSFPDPDVLYVDGLSTPVTPTYPVVAYSHRDGDAVFGGFVYRGARLPQLQGKYVFGDITTGRIFYADLSEMIAANDGHAGSLASLHELQVLFDSPYDTPDRGLTLTRLFDVVADEYAARGGVASLGAVLPDPEDHMSDGVDPDGVPYGGGRADIRVAVDGNGELLILSKSDGMVRTAVAVVTGPTRTTLTTSPQPSAAAETIQLSARVTARGATPAGEVEFFDGATPLGAATLVDGVATLDLATLVPGSHMITARYAGMPVTFLASNSLPVEHLVMAPDSYVVTVTTAGTGAGTVTSSPGDISCPGVCTAEFLRGTIVTLTPHPNATSTFTSWSGACAATESCTITVEEITQITATFSPAKPNLKAVVVAVPASGAPGGKLAISETTSNDGTAAATTSRTQYHLSADLLRGAGDVAIGSRWVSPLAAGASSPANLSLTVPTGTTLGNYYVIACSDDQRTVAEANEQDNCGVSTRTVTIAAPDLITTTVGNPPAQVAPGATFSATDTVINQGGHTAASSTTRYYLSADGVRNTGDILLSGTRSVTSLTPGLTASGSKVVTLPSATPLRSYYVLACADDLKKVLELNEGNNCRASTSQVVVTRPDLMTSAVSNPPAQTAPGRTFSITDTVVNHGQASAPATTTRYYLSANALKDAGDILLTVTRSVTILAPGAVSTGSRTVTVPTTTAAGAYRVLACADDTAKVVEGLETDNCAASAQAVQVLYPDLAQITVNNPPTSGSVGGTFTVIDTVANQGAITTLATKTRYYLSLDTSKDAADALIAASRSLGSVAAGASNTGSRVVTIPTIAAGTYYLLACADDTKLAVESNEGNNCRHAAATVTIRP